MGNILDIIKQELLDFYTLNNRFPKSYEFQRRYNFFSYSYSKVINTFKENNEVYQDYLASIDCFSLRKPSDKYYYIYLDKLIDFVNSDDKNIGKNLFEFSRREDVRLPDIRWFIHHCPCKEVTDLESFKKWCGLTCSFLSKEECEFFILEKAKQLKRPLKYDDFRGTGYQNVTIEMIRRYWGSLNKMKAELGLEIIQPKMEKISQKEIDADIAFVKEYLDSQGRGFITTQEWDSLDKIHNAETIRKYAKNNYNLSLVDYLQNFGISLGKQGRGICYSFSDGERTTSQFEYLFSSFLRNNNLLYDRDYFRNVKYNTLDSKYAGMMDCDYVIYIKTQPIYIEIAGVIANYKEWYYSNRKIKSSDSKEKYRLKLSQKEKMLKKNGLMYFILFPCDLLTNNLNAILLNPTYDLRNKIEQYNKHNIDWKNITTL